MARVWRKMVRRWFCCSIFGHTCFILFLRAFWKKYSFLLKKQSFLYITCTSSCSQLVKIVGHLITVCLTCSVRFSQNLRSSPYSVTIIRSIIVYTVGSAKTWYQNNSDYTGRWWSRASKFWAFSGFFMKVIIINNNIKTLHIYYTTYLTSKIIGIIIKKIF